MDIYTWIIKISVGGIITMKRKLLILIVLFFISSLSGCSSSNDEKIFGEYEFEKTIYFSPVSSSFPKIETLAKTKYIIKKDRFEIISPENEFKISNPIYERKEMNDDLEQAFNDAVFDTVSISKYKEKYQYSIYEKENIKVQYYLYSLDNELWIALYNAKINRYEIWYLYKLK